MQSFFTSPRYLDAQDVRKERAFISQMMQHPNQETELMRSKLRGDVLRDYKRRWGKRRNPNKVLGVYGPGGDFTRQEFEDNFDVSQVIKPILNEGMEFKFHNENGAKEFEKLVANSAMGMAKTVGSSVHVHVLPPRTTHVKNSIVTAARDLGGNLMSTQPYTDDSYHANTELSEGSLSRSRVSRAGETGRPGREQAWALRQGMRLASRMNPEEIAKVVRGDRFTTGASRVSEFPEGIYPSHARRPGAVPPTDLSPHKGKMYHNPHYGRDMVASSRIPQTAETMRTSGHQDAMGTRNVTPRSLLNHLSALLAQRGQRLGQHNQDAQVS